MTPRIFGKSKEFHTQAPDIFEPAKLMEQLVSQPSACINQGDAFAKPSQAGRGTGTVCRRPTGPEEPLPRGSPWSADMHFPAFYGIRIKRIGLHNSITTSTPHRLSSRDLAWVVLQLLDRMPSRLIKLIGASRSAALDLRSPHHHHSCIPSPMQRRLPMRQTSQVTHRDAVMVRSRAEAEEAPSSSYR